MPTPPFNHAAYCLAPGPLRPADKMALLVVHDPHDPGRGVEGWTYGQLDQAVRSCAAGLLGLGLAAGDRVVLHLGNSSTFPLMHYAAMAAGLVSVPTSTMLTSAEVAFVAEDCRAVAIAASEELEVDLPLVRVTPDLIASWVAGGASMPYASTGSEDLAFIVYSSGTTGAAKGIRHAHRSVLGRQPMYAHWLGLRHSDVLLHAGALSWSFTLGVGLTDPWATGATAVVYAGERDPTVWPRIIEETGATLFAAVPGVYRQLLASGGLVGHQIDTLRHGVTAGEALAPALLARWRDATGLELYEALGMSEISTFVSAGPTVPVRAGSAGRPQVGRRIAVLPEDSSSTTPVPAGQPGLLSVHHSDPGLMLGYWERPDLDAVAWRGEWFVSADVVHLDEDGYVVHHGRRDDMMNTLGYLVSPVEVERCLADHPAVEAVAVTDVTVGEGLRIVTAFVVPAPGHVLDEQALLEYARQHLASYKCPRRVVTVDDLPRTRNGKLRRAELRTAFPAAGA